MTSARRLHHSYEHYLRALEVSGVTGETVTLVDPALELSVDALYAEIQLDDP